MMFTMSWWMIEIMVVVVMIKISSDDCDDVDESHKLVEEVETSPAQVGKGMGCELLLPTARS
eukprot:525593-Hanusia_phi.AAC.1